MRGVWIVGVIGVAVYACGSERASRDAKGDAAPSRFDETALRALHVAYNTKTCEASERCDPVFFKSTYGTIGACVEAEAAQADVNDPYGFGTTVDPDNARACIDALDFTRCEDWFRYRYEVVVPDVCRPLHYGTLPNDAPCGRWSQCASGRCVAEADAPPGACGRCVATVAPGGRCLEQFDCAPGSTCMGPDAVTRTCKSFHAIDEACSAEEPCSYWLVCSGGTCRAPSEDGTCDPDAGGCPALPNLRFCDPKEKKCTDWTLEGIGGLCGPIGNAGYGIRCRAGGTCTRSPGDNGFVCTSKIELGGTCDPLAHPYANTGEGPCRIGTCWDNRCARRGAAECTAPAVPP